MTYREGCKHLHIDVCTSRSTCGPSVQTPATTERGHEWDAVPTHRHCVSFEKPLCISLIHIELPHGKAGPAGDSKPSAAGAGGPAGHSRDVQKALNACVWAIVGT